MSELLEHYSLEKRNTFGLIASSRYFFEATSIPDLQKYCKEELRPSSPFMILGEGSNILFKGDYKGTIIHPALKGIEILSEDPESVCVNVNAGENWDDFVQFCVGHNWYGLENLSLIPGSTGSSPVQNIGAYGVEAKDRIEEVQGFFIYSSEKRTFSNQECSFGYRNSIFKQDLKNSFLITSVSFRLQKHQCFELGYEPVESEFMKKPVQDLATLRQTIIDIRSSKLPDPSKLGNAGSFFKNPVISHSDFAILKKQFPDLPTYPTGKENIKIPAAWLIEQAGWKGVREGNTGTYPSQPLVIVNYGNASGEEIYNFALKIVDSVHHMFGVQLEMEVNLV